MDEGLAKRVSVQAPMAMSIAEFNQQESRADAELVGEKDRISSVFQGIRGSFCRVGLAAPNTACKQEDRPVQAWVAAHVEAIAKALIAIEPDLTEEERMKTGCKLDRLDLRILSELQKRGRITNVQLADAVGLSPSPCLTRVKRLEKTGYIAGYGAQVQIEKLGDFQVVFTEITLTDHRREDFVRFIDAIRGVDEIMECHHATGGYDYLLKFVTRNISHYQGVIEALLERDIGINKFCSYMIIKSPVVKTHYRLETIFAGG